MESLVVLIFLNNRHSSANILASDDVDLAWDSWDET
jgi:hypothetical protein